ncbi:MAG TPA: ParA family protein [Acidimicrobiales bacterium]
MKTIATYSIKGGVGKTTSAVNLAHEAARGGARVLLWDLDPQGAATFFFRVRPKMKGGSERLVGAKGELERHIRSTGIPGVHVVPADFSLRHLDLHLDATKHPTTRLSALLVPLRWRYDLALLDCAPSISLASEGVFAATDALVVPVIPAALSARTLEQLVEFLRERESPPRIMAHFSMVDRRRKLHRELVEGPMAQSSLFLRTVIPSSSLVERMGHERAPLAAFAPSSAPARAFAALWAEIADRLW